MRRNWLEWAILAASVAAIVGLVGYLLLQVVADDGPARISVEAQAAEGAPAPTGWTLPVVVRNDGGEAAGTVVIEAAATVGGEEEVAELTIELLPARSEAALVVGFSDRPEGEVSFRLVGYESP